MFVLANKNSCIQIKLWNFVKDNELDNEEDEEDDDNDDDDDVEEVREEDREFSNSFSDIIKVNFHQKLIKKYQKFCEILKILFLSNPSYKEGLP